MPDDKFHIELLEKDGVGIVGFSIAATENCSEDVKDFFKTFAGAAINNDGLAEVKIDRLIFTNNATSSTIHLECGAKYVAIINHLFSVSQGQFAVFQLEEPRCGFGLAINPQLIKTGVGLSIDKSEIEHPTEGCDPLFPQ